MERWTISVPDDTAKEVMSQLSWGDNRSAWVVDAIERKLEDQQQGDVTEEPVDDAPDGVEALLAEWSPSTQANDARARRETVRAYRWLAEQSEPQKRSEIVAACAGDIELGERTWWERAVQPGLRYLVEKGYVEYRSGYHDYSASGR